MHLFLSQTRKMCKKMGKTNREKKEEGGFIFVANMQIIHKEIGKANREKKEEE